MLRADETNKGARRTRVAALASLALVGTAIVAAPRSVEAADHPLPEESVGPARSVVSERSEPKNWGVGGFGDEGGIDFFNTVNPHVTAFAEIGDTIYVGGKFATVDSFSPSASYDQPFLAAFDRDSGEWVQSFRPDVDGVVWDLLPRPDGTLLVAGQFDNIGGQPNTSGLAVIDAITGDPDPSFTASLQQHGGPGLAMTLEQVGDVVYVGGLFNWLTNANGVPRPVGRIARIDLTSGQLDGSWRPNVDGTVWDLAEHDDVIYLAGSITYVDGVRRVNSARISTLTPTLLPGSHHPRGRSYQQTVIVTNEKVYIGGSEHQLQADDLEFELIKEWTTGSGDFQAMTEAEGYVYAGNHGSDTITDGVQREPYNFVVVVDSENDTLEPWVGALTSGQEGVWALFTDSADCVWAGGDFRDTVRTGGVAVPAGSFARFCPPDRTPPSVPPAPSAVVGADGVEIIWGASTDASTPITYEVYRDGNLIASDGQRRDVIDPTGTASNVYRVRAVDARGNKSATTAPVIPAVPGEGANPNPVIELVGFDGMAPATATFSSAASSDDDGTIVAWFWEFGDGAISTEADPTHLYRAGGSYDVALRVVDDDGRSTRTVLTIDVPGLGESPGAPVYRYDDATHSETWSWEPAVDAVRYVLHLDGQPFMEAETTEIEVFLPPGRHSLTVTAWRLDGTATPPSAATTVTSYAPANYSIGALASMSAPRHVRSTADLAIDGITEQAYPDVAYTTKSRDSRIEVDLRRALTFDTITYHNGTWSQHLIDNATLMTSPTALPPSTDDALAVAEWHTVFPRDTGAEASFKLDPTPTRVVRIAEKFTYVQVAELELLHHARPPSIEGLGGDAPVAQAAVVEILDDTTVSFTSDGSTDPDGAVGRYYWNFGDGTYSHDANPVHEYLIGGPRTVTLQVADELGKLSAPHVLHLDIAGPELSPGQPFLDRATEQWEWSWQPAPDALGYDVIVDGVVVATTPDTSIVYDPGPGNHDVVVRGLDSLGLGGFSPSTQVLGESHDSLTPFGAITATPAESSSTDVERVRDGRLGGSSAYVSILDDEPFLEVELSRIESLSSIELTNRNSDANRIVGARVLLSTEPMPASLQEAELVADRVFTIDESFTGTLILDAQGVGAKYIRVQLSDRDQLQIAELGIFRVVYPTTIAYEIDTPSAPPVPLPTVVSSTPTLGGAIVEFTASASSDDGSVIDYFWHFEPGRFSRVESPTHEFTTSGTKHVRVTAVDNHGLATTVSLLVDVSPIDLDPGVPTVEVPEGGLVVDLPSTWSWTPAADAVGYEVGVDDVVVSSGPETTTELTIGAGPHVVHLVGVGPGGEVGDPISVTVSSDPVVSVDYGARAPSAAPNPAIALTDVTYPDPTTTSFTLDGTGSSDDGAVRQFWWNLPDGSTSTEPAVALELPPGSYPVTLTIVDDHGQIAAISETIDVPSEPIDTESPGYVQNLAGSQIGDGEVVLTWSPATDDVGVTGYVVLRNGTEIATTPETTATITGLPDGNSWFQLVAFDAAGNRSGRTAPLRIELIPTVDTDPPGYVRDLAGSQTGPGEVELTWSPATDNVGVTGYVVLRNGAEVATTPETTITITGLPSGGSWFQLVAFDAAGNRGGRTAPLLIELG